MTEESTHSYSKLNSHCSPLDLCAALKNSDQRHLWKKGFVSSLIAIRAGTHAGRTCKAAGVMEQCCFPDLLSGSQSAAYPIQSRLICLHTVPSINTIPTGQSEGGSSSTELVSSQVNLGCAKLTELISIVTTI